MHKNIRYLAYGVLACLAFLVIYIGFIPLYISHVQSQSKNGKAAWLNDPRLLKKMQEKQAGGIYDRRGAILAQTVTGQEGVNKRQYPMGHNFAHIIGYNSTKYGLTGIEAGLSSVLLGAISGNGSMSESELAFTAIGQGKAVANPMQMAIVACGLANKGIVMHPTLVKKIISPKGETIQEAKPDVWLNVIGSEQAEIIKDYMVAVVREGSGTRASIPGIEVAGKTGTAENSGRAHAWFVGFAPASNPEVAVAAIIENGGSGGAVAAPVAREIMRRAIDM